MDHITRCPNCSTAFRVTDEQLAAFMGKVRCGRCAFVFNAREVLIPQTPQQPEPVPPELRAEFQPEEPAQPEPEEISPPASLPIEEPEQETAQPEVEPVTHDTPSVAELYTQALKELEATESQTNTPATIDDEEDPTALMHTAADDFPTNAFETPGGYHPITLPEDEALFAPIPKPRHARIWTFFTLLGGLALALQLLYASRVRLVMEFPALQPRLNHLCSILGCDMPLPRQADLLRLEWSELTYVPDHPSLIQLSATLRNLAQYEQVLPLLELTLTDTQERVVARRIFRPNEYLSATEKSRSSLPGHDELHAFLQLETGELKSTGYSLYWFYE